MAVSRTSHSDESPAKSADAHGSAESGGFYRWLLVGVLFCIACLNYADRGALNAVFPLLRKELGMSDVALAATSSIFLWTYAILSPLAGYVGDRFSRSSIIVWSLAAWSTVMVLNGLAQTQGQLLAMRIPLGIAEALYIPASIALISDHHTGATRGKAFSIHLCGFYTGNIAGASISGYLGGLYGWRTPQFVLGLIGLGFALVASRVLRDAPATGERPQAAASEAGLLASFKDVARFATYWFLLIDAFLMAAVMYILSTWLPLYLHEAFRLDLGAAGFQGTFFIMAGSVLGVLIGGAFSDAVGQNNKRRRMLLQLLASMLSVPLLLVFVLSPSLIVLEAALFAFAMIRYGGGANANPLLCDLIPANRRSVAFGVMNLSSCLAGGAGVMIAGILKAKYELLSIFASASLILLAAALILWLGYAKFLAKDLDRASA
ncbi:MAG: MFS transporter [Bryobacteraceae bacterium]